MNLNLAKYLDRYVGIILCYALAALHLFREMISPRDEPIRVRRVLMVKFWGVGNIVLLLPIIRLVRQRFPEAEIHFLTFSRNREILDGNPHLDRIWTVDESRPARLIGSLLSRMAELRRARIDLYLDFEQFARLSALLGFVIGAPQRIGLKTPRQGRFVLYTAPVRYREDQHMSGTFLDVARAAGVRETRYEPAPVPFGEREVARVEHLLGRVEGRLVVLHVGSGDNFVGRRWPPESFARLTDLLVRKHGIAPVFTGANGEGGLVRQVISLMEERERARSLVGLLGLRDLAALLARSALLLSNDTGPVHVASSLGLPVLGFYGPNTPVLYGPLSPGSHGFYKDLPCSPCITNINYKTSFCRFPVCIRNITVDEVEEEADRLLESRRGAAS
ncbi:MAG: glycosyltransferase family 9 protein [Planctomycetota bacterium]|jgi:ADP-heptose:LPS heptosyltransferase